MTFFALPHTFHDGTNEPASGAAVNEDLQVLKERIELLEAGNGPLLLLAGSGLHIAGGLFVPGGGFDSAAGRSRRSDSINHGLGVIPKWVSVTSTPINITENGGATPEAVAVSVVSLDITHINIVSTAPGTTNNGANVYWIAVG